MQALPNFSVVPGGLLKLCDSTCMCTHFSDGSRDCESLEASTLVQAAQGEEKHTYTYVTTSTVHGDIFAGKTLHTDFRFSPPNKKGV